VCEHVSVCVEIQSRQNVTLQHWHTNTHPNTTPSPLTPMPPPTHTHSHIQPTHTHTLTTHPQDRQVLHCRSFTPPEWLALFRREPLPALDRLPMVPPLPTSRTHVGGSTARPTGPSLHLLSVCMCVYVCVCVRVYVRECVCMCVCTCV